MRGSGVRHPGCSRCAIEAGRLIRPLALFWVALAVGLVLPVVAGLQAGQCVSPIGKAIALGLMALAVVQARLPAGAPLLLASLLLFAAGVLVAPQSFPLATILYTIAHLLMTGLFLQNIRRRRWLLPLGLAAVGYALAALAVLLLGSWPGWVGPMLVYVGFLAAVLASAAVSRFPWAGLGALIFVMADLLGIARVREWPDAAIADNVVWTLFFTGTAIMLADVIRGPAALLPRA